MQIPDHSTGVNISSDTLFHFTSSLDHLLNILENDFSPRYCPEYITADASGKNPIEALPMVCFCDLPIFLVNRHLSNYGNYGIGLTKEWGIRSELTPVLYVHGNSPTLTSLTPLLRIALKDVKQSMSDKDTGHISRILSYVRPIEGPAWRKGKQINNVRFYNEREWRFVPFIDNPTLTHKLSFQESQNNSRLVEANTEMARHFKLSFTPSDIRYIIVNSDSEIIPMIAKLEAVKSRFSLAEVKILTTRIITAQQIRLDF